MITRLAQVFWIVQNQQFLDFRSDPIKCFRASSPCKLFCCDAGSSSLNRSIESKFWLGPQSIS